VELEATTDAPTILNLAHHSYFNLDGSADVRDHEVRFNCHFVTPTDADLIPTGEIRAVAGTPFDFTASRPIRNEAGQLYDINFVIAPMPDPATGLAHAATVRSPKNGLTLDVHTDQPGLQFYDAAKLWCPVPGLGGAHYGPHSGLALECQLFPDAPHRRHFPSAVLRPGQTYRQHSEYRFA
jgi:aldose 1-epimerase